MNLEQLQTLLDVVRLGSFAAVAREHQLDPSSVSRQISALEKSLNTRLLQRSTRRMTLTEAGRSFVQRIDPMLEEIRHAANEVQDQQGGSRLRLTASTAFGHTQILPLVETFQQQHPGIDLDLIFTDANLELIKENIDLAVRLSPQFDSDLVGTRLFSTHYKVCVSPDYPHPPPEHPQQLSQHPCLVFTLPSYRTRWFFQPKGGERPVEEIAIQSKLAISNALTLREATLAGQGPALLANWLVDEDLEAGRLKQWLPEHRVTATDFNTAAWLLYPSRRYLPQKVRAMIDFLKSQLAREAG